MAFCSASTLVNPSAAAAALSPPNCRASAETLCGRNSWLFRESRRTRIGRTPTRRRRYCCQRAHRRWRYSRHPKLRRPRLAPRCLWRPCRPVSGPAGSTPLVVSACTPTQRRGHHWYHCWLDCCQRAHRRWRYSRLRKERQKCLEMRRRMGRLWRPCRRVWPAGSARQRRGGLGARGGTPEGALLAYVEGGDWPSGGGIGDNG
jgi:hypothetical protein